MNKIINKILLSLFLFLPFIIPAYGLNINSENAVLYNLNDNNIILNAHKDEQINIASLTKIMTNIVAIENIENLQDKVIITTEMIKNLREQDAYVVGLKEGQEVTYEDLLYASLISSGADASNALAISISGSVEGFVKLMNNKAKELNLTKTNFANPIGLDDKKNYSSVDDIAHLLMYAYKNETFKEIFSSNSYQFKDKSMEVKSALRYMAKKSNINIDFIIGGKTGYTEDAGRCLASIAYDKKNNIYYLLVTAKADAIYNKFYNIEDAYKIYNYYFENYKYYKIINKNDLLLSIDIKNKKEKVNYYSKSDVYCYSNKEVDRKDIAIEYEGKKQVDETIKKNDSLGQINIYCKGVNVKKIDITMEKDLKLNFLELIKENRFTIISFTIFVVGLTTFSITIIKTNKRKKVLL